MPKIGTFGNRSRIRTDVAATPSRSIGQAGIRGRASAQLANQVGEFATQIGKQRALAERNSDTLDFAAEFGKAQNEIKLSIDSEFAGTDMQGYAKTLLHDEDEAFNKIKGKYGLSQGHIENIYKQQRIRNETVYSNQEKKKVLDASYDRKLNNIKTMSQTVSEAPSKSNLMRELDALLISNSSDVVTFRPERVRHLEKGPSIVVDAALTSKIDGSTAEMLEAKKWLEEDEEQSKRIREALTPAQLHKFKARINKRLKSSQGLDLDSFTTATKKANDALQTEVEKGTFNEAHNQEGITLADNMQKQVDRFKGSHPKAVKPLILAISDLRATTASADFDKDMTDVKTSELKIKTNEEIGDESFIKGDEAATLAITKKKKALRDDEIKLRRTDGAEVASKRTDIEEGSDRSMAWQGSREVYPPRYLRNSTVTFWKDIVNNSTNIGQDLDAELQKVPDGNGLKALAQSATTPGGKDLANYVQASTINDPLIRSKLMKTNLTKAKGNFEARNNHDETKFNTAWKDAHVDTGFFSSTDLGEWQEKFNDKHGFITGLTRQMEAQARNEATNPDNYKEVANRVFTDVHSQFIEVDVDGGNGFLVAKGTNLDEQYTEALIKAVQREPMLLTKLFPIDLDRQGFPEGTFENMEEFVEHMVDNDGKFEPTTGNDGMSYSYNANGIRRGIVVELDDVRGKEAATINWDQLKPGGDFHQISEDELNEGSFLRDFFSSTNKAFQQIEDAKKSQIEKAKVGPFPEAQFKGADINAAAKPVDFKLFKTPSVPDRIAKRLLMREGSGKNKQGKYISEDRKVNGKKEGFLTAGIGHKLTKAEAEKYPEGTEIPEAQVTKWFKEDSVKFYNFAKKIMPAGAPDKLIDIVTDMSFQFGRAGVLELRAIKLMQQGKYKEAAKALEKTKWATKQTPGRAKDIMKELREL